MMSGTRGKVSGRATLMCPFLHGPADSRTGSALVWPAGQLPALGSHAWRWPTGRCVRLRGGWAAGSREGLRCGIEGSVGHGARNRWGFGAGA